MKDITPRMLLIVFCLGLAVASNNTKEVEYFTKELEGFIEL